MLDFLSTIADSIGLFLQFLGNTISGVMQVFGIAGQSILWLNVALGYLPSVFMGFATLGILISLFYFLLGR